MNEPKDQSPLVERLSRVSQALEKLRKFWHTKKAIDRGEALYEWVPEKLAESGFYGPWGFNAFETVLAGGIAAMAANIVGAIFGGQKHSNELAGASPEFLSMLEKTSGWVSPFFVPILTTSIVFLVGWGSLWPEDSDPVKRSRARRAYLYFDGAYGLYSQLLLSAIISILIQYAGADSGAKIQEHFPLIRMTLIAVFVLCVLVLSYVSVWKIPRKLLRLNGYSVRNRKMWQKPREDDPPWGRLTLAFFLGTPLLFVVAITLNLIARALAHALLWIRTLAGIG